jgi:hypothetical protein
MPTYKGLTDRQLIEAIYKRLGRVAALCEPNEYVCANYVLCERCKQPLHEHRKESDELRCADGRSYLSGIKFRSPLEAELDRSHAREDAIARQRDDAWAKLKALHDEYAFFMSYSARERERLRTAVMVLTNGQGLYCLRAAAGRGVCTDKQDMCNHCAAKAVLDDTSKPS